MEAVFNVVLNDDGVLKEIAQVDEEEARKLRDWLDHWLEDPIEPPETPEAVRQMRDSLNEWLGED